MGFKRTIGWAVPTLASLSSAALAAEREPLSITTFREGEAALQPVGIRDEAPRQAAFDIEAFSRAVSEAIRVQQQSIEAKCRSADRHAGTIAARWAWEASCRYPRY